MPTILALVTTAKLRVTIIGLNYWPEPTGNAPYTSSLAEGLSAAGHSVRVITGYPHYPEWKLAEGYTGWSREEAVNGVQVKRLRHYIPKRPTTLQRLHMEVSFGIRSLFARWGDPDVVLLVSPALFSSGIVALRERMRRRGPSVGIWVQDIYSRGVVETGTGGGRVGKVVGTLEAAILRSADGVVAIHDRFKSYMVHSLGVQDSKVRVIRNWTHLPASPVSGHAEMRAQLGWSAEDVVVLHAGNMGMKQGLGNVIEAARIAQGRKSNVKFVLMGDGNQREKLEEMSTGLGNVQFVDPLPDKQFLRALAAADLLLVNERPGVRDMAVPSKLTSYFNTGLPVIAATDDGSVTASEIQASGGGVRVDADSPAGLVDIAEALGRDAAAASELGSRGLRFRNETLSEAAAIAHYNEFITSLAVSRDQ